MGGRQGTMAKPIDYEWIDQIITEFSNQARRECQIHESSTANTARTNVINASSIRRYETLLQSLYPGSLIGKCHAPENR